MGEQPLSVKETLWNIALAIKAFFSLMWRWGVRMYIESSGKWNVVVTFLS